MDGCVCQVWNVQNGHNLHHLEAVDDTEIAGIVCVPEKKSILVVGWSRKIALYNDTEPDVRRGGGGEEEAETLSSALGIRFCSRDQQILPLFSKG